MRPAGPAGSPGLVSVTPSTPTRALGTSNTAMLSYVVPAGHWVKLVSTVSGTGTTAIVSQVEETLN